MGFKFGLKSQTKLMGVHPRLRAVCNRAIEISTQDFLVLEGARSVARQHELYGKGRTASDCRAKGVDPIHARPREAKVTWTLFSNHFPKGDGFSKAVDLCPHPVDWEGPTRFPKFDAIAKAMFQAADELGIPIRWGADWDRDGKPRERGESDSPHFELV